MPSSAGAIGLTRIPSSNIFLGGGGVDGLATGLATSSFPFPLSSFLGGAGASSFLLPPLLLLLLLLLLLDDFMGSTLIPSSSDLCCDERDRRERLDLLAVLEREACTSVASEGLWSPSDPDPDPDPDPEPLYSRKLLLANDFGVLGRAVLAGTSTRVAQSRILRETVGFCVCWTKFLGSGCGPLGVCLDLFIQ